MSRALSSLVYVLLLVVAGCTEHIVAPEADSDLSTRAATAGAGEAKRHPGRLFEASLTGEAEIPPVETSATGAATFIIEDRNVVNYKVAVSGLADVVAAHIHCAPAGVAGPVGVTLFVGGPVTPPKTLAQGVFTEPDAGNACGWANAADVVNAMAGGGAYVNVHTLGHPSGEIRGQIAEIRTL